MFFGLTAKSSLKENPVTLSQSDVTELLDAIVGGALVCAPPIRNASIRSGCTTPKIDGMCPERLCP